MSQHALNFVASMWWLAGKSNRTKLQPTSQAFRFIISLLLLYCFVKSGLSYLLPLVLLCYMYLRITNLPRSNRGRKKSVVLKNLTPKRNAPVDNYLYVHVDMLVNSFLFPWRVDTTAAVQEKYMKDDEFVQQTSRMQWGWRWHPHFCSTTVETCQCGIPTTVAREPWTCMNPCSSAVDVLWSALVVAWCVVACCHHLLEWMRNTWEEMYSQRRTVLWSNVSFCHEGLFSVDSTVDLTPLPL